MQFPFSFWKLGTGLGVGGDDSGGDSTNPNISFSGLIAYYKLDNESLQDSTPNHYNMQGSLDNLVFVGGIIDNGFKSTGNNWIERSSSAGFQANVEDKTFTFWINNFRDSGIHVFLSKTWDTIDPFIGGTGGYVFYSDEKNTPNTIYFSTHNILSAITHSGFTPNNWHFIVGWINQNDNTINLQVDNIDTGVSTVGGFIDSSQPFSIGTIPINTDYSGIFIVDEVSIWSRILTSGEKTYLYNNGTGRTYPF